MTFSSTNPFYGWYLAAMWFLFFHIVTCLAFYNILSLHEFVATCLCSCCWYCHVESKCDKVNCRPSFFTISCHYVNFVLNFLVDIESKCVKFNFMSQYTSSDFNKINLLSLLITCKTMGWLVFEWIMTWPCDSRQTHVSGVVSFRWLQCFGSHNF
jgi:hypothetical protein